MAGCQSIVERYVESVLAFFSVSSVASSSAALFVPDVLGVDFVSVTSVVDLTGAVAVFATGFFLTTMPFIRLFMSFFGAFTGNLFAVVDVDADVEAPGKLGAGTDACLAARCLPNISDLSSIDFEIYVIARVRRRTVYILPIHSSPALQ